MSSECVIYTNNLLADEQNTVSEKTKIASKDHVLTLSSLVQQHLNISFAFIDLQKLFHKWIDTMWIINCITR